MKKFIKIVFFVLVSCALSLVTYAQQEEVANSKATTENPGTTKVKITTDMGEMVVLLYDATPKHRDNFIKLVQQGFYDSLLFHRIIQGFMIQGGDPLSKNAAAGAMLGMGGGEMQRIPAEFNRNLIHKKGALAAARDGNPEKASSACQFYIVQGRVYNDKSLDSVETYRLNGRKIPVEQREVYKTLGGAPHLDQTYTIFGELVSGFDVIDKIANTKTNGRRSGDKPVVDIRIKKVKLIKRDK